MCSKEERWSCEVSVVIKVSPPRAAVADQQGIADTPECGAIFRVPPPAV